MVPTHPLTQQPTHHTYSLTHTLQVVQLYGVYEDRWNINLVMEWCPGGSLLSAAQAAPGGRLREEQVASVMGAVLRALATCHAW